MAAVRHMEGLEQGDGWKVNRKKLGAVASHPCLKKLVEEANQIRGAAPFGMVLGFGEQEPEGWQLLWRNLLGASPATVFRWRCSQPEAGPSPEAAVGLSLAALAAGKAAFAAAEEARAAAESLEAAVAALWSACTAAAILSQPLLAGGAGELHAAQSAGVAESALAVEAARLAAAISASTSAEAKLQAEAAKELAAEALVAVADLRALASATTVWLAFDGLPPDEGAGEVLKANRGAWMSAVTLVKESFVAAKVSLLQDSDPARWHRGPPLVLQVVPAIKDLGVAQGAGRVGKELQAARARVAFDRLALVGKLGVP